MHGSTALSAYVFAKMARVTVTRRGFVVAYTTSSERTERRSAIEIEIETETEKHSETLLAARIDLYAESSCVGFPAR